MALPVARPGQQDPIYEGTRIPSPIPTVLEVDPAVKDTDDILTVNFGPNHPSTHGVLRLIVDLDGEVVVGVHAKVGYVHTGFEKNMEQKSWWKAITYAPRIDYLAYQNNELVFVLAIEKLLGLEVPPKATWMRMLLSELVAGYRMHTRYFQTGGLAEDIPAGFYPECRKFVEWMPKAIADYDALLAKNEIWEDRTVGLGLLNRRDAIALGQTGPVLRASGVDWDLRRDDPYLYYDRVRFHVPVFPQGDTYDRYRVRIEEMQASVEIVEQCLDRLERLEGEPWISDDRKVVLPPREELHTSMESLIHHFKIVTEGYRVPEGEVYVAVESPRGELGCYVVSDGGARPWRVKFRAPSFAALEATATMVQGAYIADLIAIVGSLDTVMGEVDR